MSRPLSPEEEKQVVTFFPVYIISFIGQCVAASYVIAFLFDKEYFLSILCILIAIGLKLVSDKFLPPFNNLGNRKI